MSMNAVLICLLLMLENRVERNKCYNVVFHSKEQSSFFKDTISVTSVFASCSMNLISFVGRCVYVDVSFV